MNKDFENIKTGFYRNNYTKEIYYVYGVSKDNMVSAIRQSINQFMFDNKIKIPSCTFNNHYKMIDKQKNFCLKIDKHGNYLIDEKTIKAFEKLIWIDWLFITLTALLLLPIFVYFYSTLIFGDLYFSGKQEFIAILMAGVWLIMVAPIYPAIISKIKRSR